MNTTTSISTGSILQLRSGNAGSGKYDGIAHRSFTGLDSNWIFEFQNAAGTNRGQITGNGSGGVLYQTSSDRRLKTNIQEMPSMYDKIKNLKPSKFNWKIDNKEDYGFIAQEIEEKYPDLVWTDKYGYKNLQYELLVSVGISALIENQKRVEVLNNFLKDLSTKIGG